MTPSPLLLDNTVLTNFALVGRVNLGRLTLEEGNALLTGMIAQGYRSTVGALDELL